MSTKIYNGFKIDTTEPAKLLELVRAFRPWVGEQQMAVYEEWCALVNKVRARGKDHPEYYADCFWPWIDARKEIKKTGLRNPVVDTDFEVTFLPFDGAMYGITYVERSKWHKEWLKQPGVSEFAYWNNTDQPDHITDADWEQRRVIWDELLPGAGVPSLNGFTIAIADPLGPDFEELRRRRKAEKKAA